MTDVAGHDELRVHGGADVWLPGERFFGASVPLVTLTVASTGVRLEQRFAFLNWVSSDLARHADPSDPRPRRHLWSAEWRQISDVWMSAGELGLSAPGRGACRFITWSRSSRREITEYLVVHGVSFEARKPTLGFLRAGRDSA
jgi:hypothetical protein